MAAAADVSTSVMSGSCCIIDSVAGFGCGVACTSLQYSLTSMRDAAGILSDAEDGISSAERRCSIMKSEPRASASSSSVSIAWLRVCGVRDSSTATACSHCQSGSQHSSTSAFGCERLLANDSGHSRCSTR